jgi:hypothetical protein
MSELLLESEVAAWLKRGRRFVRRLRQEGELQWIPGAGRAPILITKESVNQYIERRVQCQEKHYHQGSSRSAALGTSSSRAMAGRSEIAFGQKIYKSRSKGSKAG